MLIATAILVVVNPQAIIQQALDSAKNTFSLCINLVAVYAVWLGFLEIVDRSGLSSKLAKLLRPIIKPLIKPKSCEAEKLVAINFSANLLGLGNVATPSGIQAMRELGDGSDKINFSQMMFFVINACSIGLIPTTIIGLRQSYGGTTSSDIILPTFITTFLTAVLGIILVYIFKPKKAIA